VAKKGPWLKKEVPGVKLKNSRYHPTGQFSLIGEPQPFALKKFRCATPNWEEIPLKEGVG